MQNRTCTHRARLKGDDQGAPNEVPTIQSLSGFAEGHYFGVATGIMQGFAAIPTPADNASQRVNNDCAHGDIPHFSGFIRQEKRAGHRFFVLIHCCHPQSLSRKGPFAGYS